MSLLKILINFSKELSNKNHKVIIYNNTNHKKIEKGVVWKNISDLNHDIADILILVQDDWTDSDGRLLKGNEKGQQAYYNNVASELKPPIREDDSMKFQKLKELNQLKEQGVITQEEFDREKQKIL